MKILQYFFNDNKIHYSCFPFSRRFFGYSEYIDGKVIFQFLDDDFKDIITRVLGTDKIIEKFSENIMSESKASNF